MRRERDKHAAGASERVTQSRSCVWREKVRREVATTIHHGVDDCDMKDTGTATTYVTNTTLDPIVPLNLPPFVGSGFRFRVKFSSNGKNASAERLA